MMIFGAEICVQRCMVGYGALSSQAFMERGGALMLSCF
jgi:hypothetical protein